MKKPFFHYGNYLGNNYSGDGFKLKPINALDFCCFLHDIDHKFAGGNNRYADLKLMFRLFRIQKISSFKELLFWFLAWFFYGLVYTCLIRTIIPFIGRKWKEDKRRYNYSKVDRYIFMNRQMVKWGTIADEWGYLVR